MTLPDLQACPNCGHSIRVRPRDCPGCGFAIRAYRVRVTVGDRVKVLERVVAIPQENLARFKMAGDVVEEIQPPDDGSP